MTSRSTALAAVAITAASMIQEAGIFREYAPKNVQNVPGPLWKRPNAPGTRQDESAKRRRRGF